MLGRDRGGDQRRMSQEQIDTTNRGGEVVHVAVESREDKAPEQMREADKASEPAAQDLRLPRIVRETQRRTDTRELQPLSLHQFVIGRRRRDPHVVTCFGQALGQADHGKDVSPGAHRRQHDSPHHTIKPRMRGGMGSQQRGAADRG
jgi:hypothetical protein